MNATDLATDIAQRANLTQRLINDVLHRGANSRMACATCGTIREHRSLHLDNVVYTVCRRCHELTTSAR